MKHWLIALGTAALSACAANGMTTSGLATKSTVPITLTAEQKAAVEKGVRGSLKDPDSARFGEMRAVKDEKDVITVCGMVNAKNSYGGYTGAKPFMGILAVIEPVMVFGTTGMGGTDLDTHVVSTMCSSYGVQVATLSAN